MTKMTKIHSDSQSTVHDNNCLRKSLRHDIVHSMRLDETQIDQQLPVVRKC